MEIIKKVWGEEHIIVNEEYCGKLLRIKKKFRCSTHYHKLKDETFFVIKGLVLLETLGYDVLLKPGHSFHITPNQLHRFTGFEDSEMIEFSTHHSDDDSYRSDVSMELDDETFSILLESFTGKLNDVLAR